MPKKAGKPATKIKDPRLISQGTVIWHPQLQRGEVVRSVSVVLHLANGESRSYAVGEDQVEIFATQPQPVAETDIEPKRRVQESSPES